MKIKKDQVQEKERRKMLFKMIEFLGIKGFLENIFEVISRKTAEKISTKEEGWENEILALEKIFSSSDLRPEEVENLLEAVSCLRRKNKRFAENFFLMVRFLENRRFLVWIARRPDGNPRSQEEILQFLDSVGVTNPYPYGVIDTTTKKIAEKFLPQFLRGVFLTLQIVSVLFLLLITYLIW